MRTQNKNKIKLNKNKNNKLNKIKTIKGPKSLTRFFDTNGLKTRQTLKREK